MKLEPHLSWRRLVDLFQWRSCLDAFDPMAAEYARARLPERGPQVREMGLGDDVEDEAGHGLGEGTRRRVFGQCPAQLPAAE